MTKIKIDYEKCKGEDCSECMDVCPMEVFIIDGGKIRIHNPEECSLCEVCMDVCPNGAIEVVE